MKTTITQSARQFDSLPSTWKLVPFGEVLKDTTSGNLKIQQSDYLPEGSLPIIDQGKELVAGFTNNPQAAYGGDKPAIIFGDHTRHLKFIDFPFVLGADGVKVLTTAKGAHPKYLFYFLQSVNIPNTGYNRHFKYIKELTIPLPPLAEQIHIAQVLDRADRLRQQDRQLLAHYDQLVQAVFVDMFGDPARNEKGWPMKKIGTLTKVGSGSTPSREIDSYYSGTIPWVKTTEVNGARIMDTEEHISEEALRKSSCKMYPKDSVIIAMYGQGKTRGQVGILGIEACTNQACGVITLSKHFNPQFIFNYFKLCYSQLRELGRGGNQSNLNGGMIKDFEIMLPPLELQQRFTQIIAQTDTQKAATKQLQLQSEALFNSLLQQAFRGELGPPKPAGKAAGQLRLVLE